MDYRMSTNEWIMFNHQKKLDKVIEQNRYYCYCGHSVVIPPKGHRVMCTHCGHWIYKDEKQQQKNIEKIKKEEQEKELKKQQHIKEIRMEFFRNRVKKVLKNENTIK